MAALEAAVLGCEIVITKLGGPKEYFNNYAEVVDLYNVDAIGNSIVRMMNGSISYQPELSNYIIENYSSQKFIKLISDSLEKSIFK